MKKIKVLNLYACLGGNRYKWDEVADIEVTAVEWDEELARLYQERFPNDTVIVADAHQYLLDHYKEFDFIWSSPPCPSHSRARYWSSKGGRYAVQYPDLMLYQEIIFLKHFALEEQSWVVENVIPYYDPLIEAKKKGRHLYWTNFNLPSDLKERRTQLCAGTNELNRLCMFHEIDMSSYNGTQSMIKIARNLVDYEAGKNIFEVYTGQYLAKQITNGLLF